MLSERMVVNSHWEGQQQSRIDVLSLPDLLSDAGNRELQISGDSGHGTPALPSPLQVPHCHQQKVYWIFVANSWAPTVMEMSL